MVTEEVKKLVAPQLRGLVDQYIEADYSERQELTLTADFRAIRDAYGASGRSGGVLYDLRGAFAKKAPLEWRMLMAYLRKSFPDPANLTELILEWQEQGKAVPVTRYADALSR